MRSGEYSETNLNEDKSSKDIVTINRNQKEMVICGGEEINIRNRREECSATK